MDSKLQAFHQRLLPTSVDSESTCTSMVACVNDSVPTNEISSSVSIQRLYFNASLNYVVVFSTNIFQLNENEECDQVKTPFYASLKYDYSLWLAREEVIEISSNSSLESEFNKRVRTELEINW